MKMSVPARRAIRGLGKSRRSITHAVLAMLVAFCFSGGVVLASGGSMTGADREELTEWERQRIETYISRAEHYLDIGWTARARSYALRADRVREGNEPARLLLGRIDGEDPSPPSPEEPVAVSPAEPEPASEEEPRPARKREPAQLDRLVELGRRSLEEGDLNKAEYYHSRARAISAEHEKVLKLTSAIQEEQRLNEEREREERIQRISLTDEDKAAIREKFDSPELKWLSPFTKFFGRDRERHLVRKVYPGEIYSIEECVEIAKRNSLRLNMATRQLDLGRMRLLEARRGLFPDVTGRFETSTGRIFEDATTAVDYEGRKWQVELRHTVFDGLASWYEVQQAHLNRDILELERQKIENEIIESTKRAYYLLDKAYKTIELQEDKKDFFEGYYELVSAMYKEEILSRAEYLKVKSQKMQADFELLSAREDLRLAAMILLHNMNLQETDSIAIEPVPSPDKPLRVGLDNCYQLAYSHRPDLVIKAKSLEFFDLDRKINRAAGWPQVDFHGSFGRAFERSVHEDARGRHDRDMGSEWFAGITARLPLWGSTLEYRHVREEWQPSISAYRGTESATNYFNFHLLDDLEYFSNLEESEVRFANARYEYLKEKEDVTVEIKSLYFKYRRSLILKEVSEAKVEHQRTYVDILEQRVRYGELEVSKLLEEVEKLIAEKYAHMEADSNYFIALAELNRAIGLPGYFRAEGEREGAVE